MTRTRVAGVAAALAASLVVAAGCEQVIGARFDRSLAPCDPATPPAPPDGGFGGTSPIGFTFAVSSLEWGEEPVDPGQRPAYQTIGFDLDGRCSALFDPAPCQPPAWTGVTMTDGVNGIDNAVGALLFSQAQFFGLQPFTSEFLTKEIANGEHAPFAIFRVRDYDGFFADDQVTVEWLVPVALGHAPAFDGTDPFAIDPSSAIAIDGGADVQAKAVDAHAYVSNFQLVAHFGATGFRLANVIFPGTDAVVSATLHSAAKPSEWTMDGVIAGHGRSDVLLATLPALTHSFPGVTVCEDSSLYAKLKTWVCGAADTLQDGTPGPSATCDAASFGVRFTARPVAIAGIAPAPDAGALCPPSTDPASDSCAGPPAR